MNLKELLEKVEKEATDQLLEPKNVLVPESNGQNTGRDQNWRTQRVLAQAKNEHGITKEVSIKKLNEMTSALGAIVRVRIQVDGSKDGNIARYETGTVNG